MSGNKVMSVSVDGEDWHDIQTCGTNLPDDTFMMEVAQHWVCDLYGTGLILHLGQKDKPPNIVVRFIQRLLLRNKWSISSSKYGE